MYSASSDQNKSQKIKSFTDLTAWQKAHKFAVSIYKATESFPDKEQFGLTSQVRRAAVSTSSNIAEGFSRSTKADKLHFYVMALGSLTEVQSQLLIARDVGYLGEINSKSLADESVITQKLLHGLIKALKVGKGVRSE